MPHRGHCEPFSTRRSRPCEEGSCHSLRGSRRMRSPCPSDGRDPNRHRGPNRGPYHRSVPCTNLEYRADTDHDTSRGRHCLEQTLGQLRLGFYRDPCCPGRNFRCYCSLNHRIHCTSRDHHCQEHTRERRSCCCPPPHHLLVSSPTEESVLV